MRQHLVAQAFAASRRHEYKGALPLSSHARSSSALWTAHMYAVPLCSLCGDVFHCRRQPVVLLMVMHGPCSGTYLWSDAYSHGG